MRPLPFANSLAVATALFAALLFIMRFVTPRLFVFVFNSQFFGADVASLIRHDVGAMQVAGAFLVVVITTWIWGLVWGLLYAWWTTDRR